MLAPLAAADKPEWKEFAPRMQGFSIQFPAQPTIGKAGSGDNQFQTATVKRSAGNALGYTLYWRFQNKPFRNAAEAETYMEGQQKGIAATGNLVSEGQVTLGKHKGREFIVTINKTTTVRCRVFVIGKLVCTLVVQGQGPKAVKSTDAERFFKSFKLTPEKPK
jgi:hypothetical protein